MRILKAACAALAVLVSASAMASNLPNGPVTILPICLLHGPVYLEVKDYDISGFVGTDRIDLDLNEEGLTEINGNVRGVDVMLTLMRSGAVTGNIGHVPVRWFWANTPKGQIIFGYQACLFE